MTKHTLPTATSAAPFGVPAVLTSELQDSGGCSELGDAVPARALALRVEPCFASRRYRAAVAIARCAA